MNKKIAIVIFILCTVICLSMIFVACNNNGSSEFVIKNGTLIKLTDYGKTLSEIEIPDSVTKIGNNAFMNCANLKSVKMSNNVKSIESYAFANCTNLKSVSLSSALTSIDYQAFENCSSLTEITIPDSVTKIGSHVFSGCISLTSIIIPVSVKEMGSDVFSYCDDLTVYCQLESQPDTIQWSSSWVDGTPVVWNCKEYGAKDDFEWKLRYSSNTIEIVKYKGNSAQLKLPSKINGYDVTHIGQELFKDNETLTDIEIPQSVTHIGYQAFNGCANLSSVVVPIAVTDMEDSVFSKNTMIYCQIESKPEGWSTNWQYESGVVWDYKDHGVTDGIKWKLLYSTNTIEISGYVETPQQVTIPSTLNGYAVTSIGGHAFFYNSNLLSIELPSSITKIHDHAFYGCNLSSIVIPIGVTYVGHRAFVYRSDMVIYCEAAAQPEGWDKEWNCGYGDAGGNKVVWNCNAQ